VSEVGIGRRLAMDELIRREEVGRLKANESDELVDIVLEHQADRARAWDPAMGDLIEKRWVAGLLERELWEKYTAQFLVDAYEIKVRSRIVIGSPTGLTVRLVVQDARCGSGEHITYLLQEKNRITRIGKILVGRVNQPGVRGIGHNNHGEFLTNQNGIGDLWEKVKPGRQTVSYEVELAILPRGGSVPLAQREVFASKRVTFETEATFLPAGQSTVHTNVDPAMRKEVEQAIKFLAIETGPMEHPTANKKFYAKIILYFARRPIDTAFTMWLKDGEKEYEAGSIELAAAAETSVNSMASIPVDLRGKRIDLILRPSTIDAERSFDISEIWGEEIVFKDVLVK
ncbi:MAG: hypothetical protein AAF394_13265, partial [Planctomycetota bacterium]